MFIHQIEVDFKRLPVVKRLPWNAFTKDTGALYILWCNSTNTAFEIAKVLEGNAPSNSHTV